MLCEVVDCNDCSGKALWEWLLGKIQCFPGLTLCPGMFNPVVSRMLLSLLGCSLSLDGDLLIPVTFPWEHLVMVHLWERLRSFIWICYTKKKNIEECKTGLKEQVAEVVEVGAAEFLVGNGKGGELWTKQALTWGYWSWCSQPANKDDLV